ncbi:MAG: ABC transporter permease [Candidatus Faecivicinus sp.]
MLHGNLGYSYKSYQPVAQMIGSHIGPTLLLMGVSLAVGLILAVPAGIYSAVHRYQKRDFAVVTASFFGSSIPGFFLALILIYLFTVRLGRLPSSGMETAGTGGDAADIARHMVMPVIVLSASIAGGNIRYIRSAVLEILEMDCPRTARAKGMGRFLVINKHVLRNALLPIVTVVGMQIPTLFGGAVIVEQIFSWPGLGLIAMNAITGRDYPVIMGVCLLSAVVVLAANLLTGISGDGIAAFDPYALPGDAPLTKRLIEEGVQFVEDQPCAANRRIRADVLNAEDTTNYGMGAMELREAMLIFNQNTRQTEERTIESII